MCLYTQREGGKKNSLRFDIIIKEQEKRSLEKNNLFFSSNNNDSNVLMDNLDISKAFSIVNLEK
jgi:hypothetical protein